MFLSAAAPLTQALRFTATQDIDLEFHAHELLDIETTTKIDVWKELLEYYRLPSVDMIAGDSKAILQVNLF